MSKYIGLFQADESFDYHTFVYSLRTVPNGVEVALSTPLKTSAAGIMWALIWVSPALLMLHFVGFKAWSAIPILLFFAVASVTLLATVLHSMKKVTVWFFPDELRVRYGASGKVESFPNSQIAEFGIGGAEEHGEPSMLMFYCGTRRIVLREAVTDLEVRDLLRDIERHGGTLP